MCLGWVISCSIDELKLWDDDEGYNLVLLINPFVSDIYKTSQSGMRVLFDNEYIMESCTSNYSLFLALCWSNKQ